MRQAGWIIWSLPTSLNVSFNFHQCGYECAHSPLFKISKPPERSSSELLWHFLPQRGPLPYIHTRTDSKDHMSSPPLRSKRWIKHSAAGLWCPDPQHKHEYIQHINSMLPNLRWLVMWLPHPTCKPICDDTSAPPFHTNKLTSARHNVLTENFH